MSVIRSAGKTITYLHSVGDWILIDDVCRHTETRRGEDCPGPAVDVPLVRLWSGVWVLTFMSHLIVDELDKERGDLAEILRPVEFAE